MTDPISDESAGDFLTRAKDDAAIWAAEFRKTAISLGYSDMDEGWLIGWFASAIENTEVVRREAWNRRQSPAGVEPVSDLIRQALHELDNVTTLNDQDANCLGCAENLLRQALTSPPKAATITDEVLDPLEIEKLNRRWHGEDHRTVSVRWEPYKKDGRRQMGVPGRWQEQIGNGDYWRWQNCERPENLTNTAALSSEARNG